MEGSFVGLLDKLDKKQLKELLEDVTLVTDPLGQELIREAVDAHSPIGIGELPKFQNGFRDETLVRLYRLEKLGIFKSSFASTDGRTERIFSITDFGKRMVV